MNESLQQKSAIGLDGNLAAALGYPIGILGLVNFFIEKQNRFVKFHGIQSVLYSVGLWVVFTIVWVVLLVLGLILGQISSVLGGIVSILVFLLWIAIFFVWFGSLLFFAYKAYSNQMFKLPVVGNIAENLANK
jgi:uncharacterized membrane protein